MSAGNAANKLRQTSRYEARLQTVHFGVFSCFPVATIFMRHVLSTQSLWTLSTYDQLNI